MTWRPFGADLTGGRLILVLATALLLPACAGDGSMPETIACDRLVFSRLGSTGYGEADIFTLVGDRLSKLTAGGSNVNPSWTADGLVLFTSFRDGDPDLYLMTAEGYDVTPVTDDRLYESVGDLSHDGSKLVFDRVVDDDSDLSDVDETDFAQIFVAEMGSPITDVIQLTFGEPNAKPAWSPDAGSIAFLSWRDGNAEIYAMSPDGGSQTNLSRHPSYDVLPAWSPDGSLIAFVSDRDGSNQIWVMEADGSNPDKITDHEGGAWNPGWSSDGRHVLFTAQQPENVIYGIPVAGGEEQRITEGFVHDCAP